MNFYKEQILPRSWFHLLLTPADPKFQITHENLLQMTEFLDIEKRHVFDLKSIKNNLFHLFSKIAGASKISLAQKRTAIQTVKQFFGFTNEQELIDLYNSN